MKPEQLLAAAGGAVVVGALLWYLLREGDASEGEEVAAVAGEDEEEKKKRQKQQPGRQGAMDRDALMEILLEWDAVQKQARTSMKSVVSAINNEKLGFEQTYDRVKEAMPADPLAARGLTFTDLEGPLQKCEMQRDTEVLELFQSIVMSGGGGQNGAKPQNISVEKLTEINTFMAEELEKLIAHYKGLPNCASFDKQTVGAVSRIILDARIEEKYGLQQEDMEAAIQQLADKLQGNRTFWTSYQRMQKAMESLNTGEK